MRQMVGGIPTRYRPQEEEESIYQSLIGHASRSLGRCHCVEDEICRSQAES